MDLTLEKLGIRSRKEKEKEQVQTERNNSAAG